MPITFSNGDPQVANLMSIKSGTPVAFGNKRFRLEQANILFHSVSLQPTFTVCLKSGLKIQYLLVVTVKMIGHEQTIAH